MAAFREPLPKVPLGIAWRADANSVSLQFFLKEAARAATQRNAARATDPRQYAGSRSSRPALLTGAGVFVEQAFAEK